MPLSLSRKINRLFLFCSFHNQQIPYVQNKSVSVGRCFSVSILPYHAGPDLLECSDVV